MNEKPFPSSAARNHPVRRTIGAVSSLVASVLFAACASWLPSPTTTFTPQPSPDETAVMRATYQFLCAASGGILTFWPELKEVQPAHATPGRPVKVIGSGSYTTTISCPLSDGTRVPMRQSVKLYFDKQVVSELTCSVDRCEGAFIVPVDAQPGSHTVSTEGGSGIEIRVLEPAAVEATLTPSPSTLGCLGTETAEMVWPALQAVQPAQAAPGDKVKVIASGGYVRCGETGYNESARSFQLFWDEQPVAQLGCYVHHCEVEFNVPQEAGPGTHTLSVEGGSSLSLQITTP